MFYLILTQIVYILELFFSPLSTKWERLQNLYRWGFNQAKKEHWLAAINFLNGAQKIEKELNIINPERAIYQSLALVNSDLVEKNNESLITALKSKSHTISHSDKRIRDIIVINNQNIENNIENFLYRRKIPIKFEKNKSAYIQTAETAEKKNDFLVAAYYYSKALQYDYFDTSLYLKRYSVLLKSEHLMQSNGFDEIALIWLTANPKDAKKIIFQLKQSYITKKSFSNAIMLMQFYVGYIRWFKTGVFIESFLNSALALHQEINKHIKNNYDYKMFYSVYTYHYSYFQNHPLFSDELKNELLSYYPKSSPIAKEFSEETKGQTSQNKSYDSNKIYNKSLVNTNDQDKLKIPPKKIENSTTLSLITQTETKALDFNTSEKIKRNPFLKRKLKNNTLKKESKAVIEPPISDQLKSNLGSPKIGNKKTPTPTPLKVECISQVYLSRKEILDEAKRKRQQAILEEYQSIKLARQNDLKHKKNQQIDTIQQDSQNQQRKKAKKIAKFASKEARIFHFKLFNLTEKNLEKAYSDPEIKVPIDLGQPIKFLPVPNSLVENFEKIYAWQSSLKTSLIVYGGLLRDLIQGYHQCLDIDLVTSGEFIKLQQIVTLASNSKLFLTPIALNQDKTIKEQGKVFSKLTTCFFEPLKITISILHDRLLDEPDGIKKFIQTLDIYQNSLFATIVKIKNTLYLAVRDPSKFAFQHCLFNIVKIINEEKLKNDPILLLRLITALARNKKRILSTFKNTDDFENQFLYYKNLLFNIFEINPEYFNKKLLISTQRLTAFINTKIIQHENYELIKEIIKDLGVTKFLPHSIFKPVLKPSDIGINSDCKIVVPQLNANKIR